MSGEIQRYVAGLSGASGALYGLRLVEALATDPGRAVDLIVSPSAARVIAEETSRRPRLAPFDPHSLFDLDEEAAGRVRLCPFGDTGAGPASGSYLFEAMIIAPCSMKTIGAVAAGLADNLMTRSASVALKEGRPLILMPRETPFNAIHLENMLRLSRAGAAIVPANPGFYHRPQTVEDLVRFMVQKVFDRLRIPFPDARRWGAPGNGPSPE